ncbi:MAG: histidine kinase [Pseudomonadota bacterium]
MITTPHLPARPPGLARVFLAACGFWTVYMLITVLNLTVLSNRGFGKFVLSVPYNVPALLLGIAVSVATWPAVKVLSRRNGRTQLLGGVMLSMALAAPFEPLFRLGMGPKEHPGNLTLLNLLQAAVFWMAPILIWTAGSLSILHQNAVRERERRLAAAEAEARDAQMRALRYQVNPHFLHNTLNAIASLILARRLDEAEETVVQLSKFFRATLDADPLVDQPLRQEIELQRLYLAIEQVRFADFLRVRFDVPAEVEGALVPPMILQPLVENTLKHALHGPGRMTTLEISARREGDDLELTVRDDGRGAAGRHAAGVGLTNVESRLAARFPDAASMCLEPGPSGFVVRLRLPYRTVA